MIALAIYSLIPKDLQEDNSFEIKLVVEKQLNQYFDDRESISLLFPSLSTLNNQPDYLILFIAEAKVCGNCLNEINDYVNIADNYGKEIDFKTFLIYHSEETLFATRFAISSSISDFIDEYSVVNPNLISDLNLIYLISAYGAKNSLYLIDLKNNTVFHGFILPTGKTTIFKNKEIAFNNAMKTYIKYNGDR